MGARSRRHRTAAAGPEFTAVHIDRRRFLVLVGGVAALQALQPTLAWAKRAATLPALQPWRLPDALPAHPIEAARALIGAAILAPSHWNAQPWRFEVDSSELRILLDAQRTLYAARQTLLVAKLTESLNRVELYKALGGGSPPQAGGES